MDARWRSLLGRFVDARTTVVEVAPGFSDRIARALREIGFAGRLDIVEPNGAALRRTLERYTTLLPDARIVPHDRCLDDAADSLPHGRTAILMNHAFDDMLLAAAVPRDVADRIFSRMRPGSVVDPLVRELWRSMSEATSSTSSIVDRVAGELGEAVGRAAPSVVIASHYTSWYHRSADLQAADRLGARIRDRLRLRLAAHGRSFRVPAHQADDWVVAFRA